MTYIADPKYMTRKCKYPFCGSMPRFLIKVIDSVTKREHEYVVCGKHTAPGLSDVMENHENPPEVWAVPRMPRKSR